jgi:hypothetical protein
VAEDRDVGGVASKPGNILFYPFQARNHVLQPIGPRPLAAFKAEFRMREESERANTIRDADKHYSLFGETHSIIHGDAGGAAAKASSINPENDRKFFTRPFCRCPNIQVQAVFADRRGIPH